MGPKVESWAAHPSARKSSTPEIICGVVKTRKIYDRRNNYLKRRYNIFMIFQLPKSAYGSSSVSVNHFECEMKFFGIP